MTPVQFDLPMRDYLADPCPAPSMSSSLARLILDRSPEHARRAWSEDGDDDVITPAKQTNFDRGNACHLLVLGEGDAIEIVDAADWRTKAAKEARDAAREAGRTPLLPHQHEDAEEMSRCLFQILAGHECHEAFQEGAGRAEVSLFWQNGGAWKRARPDWIAYEGDTPTAIYHYKTVSESAAPHTLARMTANRGWDFTAAHYAEGCREALGHDIPQRFVVQENTAPFNATVFELDPAAMETAGMRLERATYLWARCVANDEWPGYPRRLMQIGTPEYHQARLIEMKDAENAYREHHGRDVLEAAYRWQGGHL